MGDLAANIMHAIIKSFKFTAPPRKSSSRTTSSSSRLADVSIGVCGEVMDEDYLRRPSVMMHVEGLAAKLLLPPRRQGVHFVFPGQQ